MRHDEAELALLPRLCRGNAISIDIGASHGLYSHHMLRYSAAVVAFEPVPDMHRRLIKYFGRRLVVHPVALSDKTGECELRMPSGISSRATIAAENSLEGSTSTLIESHRVPKRRLDDYGIENVGLIKIDVEGHEEAVLRGGLQTITRDRPNLLIEIEERHHPGSIARVAALLGSVGYRGYFLSGGVLIPMEQFDLGRDQRVEAIGAASDAYINNFIFFSGPA